MFISFEGLDFSGKSTQVDLLKNYFESNGKDVLLIREPGGTSISEKIRDILLDKKNSQMHIETELLLFTASRAQLVNEVIIPALNEGKIVISDRFHDSSIAYQSYGRGISLEFVKNLQNYIIRNVVPVLTFFIDVDIKEMFNRKNGILPFDLDRIELSDEQFYNKVRNGYLEIAKQEERFILINGTDSIEDIHNFILKKVLNYETTI
ncbi:MAG: dTMP kinase [Ignavibacteriaceae bacterium]|jgi:dTMP kinase|nr:dTMP kinase [Ignavibacteriaceae bacterium]